METEGEYAVAVEASVATMLNQGTNVGPIKKHLPTHKPIVNYNGLCKVLSPSILADGVLE